MSKSRQIDIALRGRLGDFAIDVTFQTEMHGITALFGPSGCGKTTVLRAIAGLSRLVGHIRIGDAIWQDDAGHAFLPSHRRAVGYVFQEPSLFAHLSVRGNLLYGARRQRRENGAQLGFDEVVALLGLQALLERAPAGLSGGERQRVAIGRALLSGPRLLLMDEPLAALDRAAKDHILPYLETLHARLALPILYVSHDISEVSRLADRMVVLAQGKVTAEGSITDVLSRLDLRPGTGRFEAGALVTAVVAEHDPTLMLTRLAFEGQDLFVPMSDWPIGQPQRLRIRARDVALALEPPRGLSIRNCLHGRVRQIDLEADTAFAETLLTIGETAIRARITRAAVHDLKLHENQEIYVLIKSIAFDRRMLGGV